MPPWAAYVSIGNVSEGVHKLEIDIIREEDQRSIFHGKGEVHVKIGGGVTLEVPVIPLNPIFPSSGKYSVNLVFGDNKIASRTIRVNQVKSDE